MHGQTLVCLLSFKSFRKVHNLNLLWHKGCFWNLIYAIIIFVLHWLGCRFCFCDWSVGRFMLDGRREGQGRDCLGCSKRIPIRDVDFSIDFHTLHLQFINKNKPLIKANKFFTCRASKSTNLF